MPFDENGDFKVPNNLRKQYEDGQKKTNPEPIDENFDDLSAGLSEVSKRSDKIKSFYMATA